MHSQSKQTGPNNVMLNLPFSLPYRPAEPTMPSANQVVHDARRGSRSPLTLPKPSRKTSTSSGLRTLFSRLFRRGSANTPPPNPNINNRRPPSPRDNVRRNTQGFRKTENSMPAEGPGAGPACRIYGSVGVKRVTGNLHVTTLGHGYMSWEHTGHHRESTTTVVLLGTEADTLGGGSLQ